ncbi:MAG: hypothetical protein ETSY1_43165 [Candidatus Entotheonella factor]|uniref:Uncharacterized protein n=1 Tax=Entotheonella factor TaxID=1429438 RepID=W4L3C6_ENTF1|nr:MAG: hypothetical protein ETSY1_43165 [Candidatus Entotheonella factor]
MVFQAQEIVLILTVFLAIQVPGETITSIAAKRHQFQLQKEQGP